MTDISKLKFDQNGLIPAIVTETGTGKVLMMAYMNEESLRISMEKGLACFWSRSRQELWLKGDTSGNYQHIVRITADCDYDTLLVEVRKDGPACHTGEESCFHNSLFDGPEPQGFTYEALLEMLKGRKDNPKEGSYTSYLFEKGDDKILKKIGEGGMSTVYLARNNRMNMQLAVKEIKNDGSKSTEILLKGLEREANILKDVDHPVIPRIMPWC